MTYIPVYQATTLLGPGKQKPCSGHQHQLQVPESPLSYDSFLMKTILLLTAVINTMTKAPRHLVKEFGLLVPERLQFIKAGKHGSRQQAQW